MKLDANITPIILQIYFWFRYRCRQGFLILDFMITHYPSLQHCSNFHCKCLSNSAKCKCNVSTTTINITTTILILIIIPIIISSRRLERQTGHNPNVNEEAGIIEDLRLQFFYAHQVKS